MSEGMRAAEQDPLHMKKAGLSKDNTALVGGTYGDVGGYNEG
jgi:hypothetical protein